MIAIVDSGPLYAAVDTNDIDHVRSRELFRGSRFELVVPSLVITEVTYFIGTRIGPVVEAAFLRSLSHLEVETPQSHEWDLIANLVEQYGDFPLGTTDAFVAVLAERLGTDVIITLDRRHFGALRTRAGQPFTLLPE